MIIRHTFPICTFPHESEHVIEKLNQIRGIKATLEDSVRGTGGTLVIESEKDLEADEVFSYGCLIEVLLHNARI